MAERFSAVARQVFAVAQHQARELGARQVRPEHLLLGVLAGDGSAGATALTELGVRHDAAVADAVVLGLAAGDALRAVGFDLATGPRARSSTAAGAELPVDEEVATAFEQARHEALVRQHPEIGTDHILLALLTASHRAVDALHRLGADPDLVRARVRRALGDAER